MDRENEPIGEIVLFQTEDGRTRLECRFVDETIWLSQAQIAELFQTTPQNVTQHLKTIHADGELQVEATCKSFLQVRIEGEREVRQSVRHYNLDSILAVGYRVRSTRGTQFRDGDSDPGATIREFRIVRSEGGREVAREIEHYNLDSILAVGYRVRSTRGGGWGDRPPHPVLRRALPASTA